MFSTALNKKRAAGLLLLVVILGLFFSLNRFPKLDTVREDLDTVTATTVACFQGFCIDRDPDSTFVSRWWDFSVTYLELVTVGMTFAFVVAGLTQGFLFPRSSGRGFSAGGVFGRTLKGLALGPVWNLCSACIVPVSAAFRRRGVGIEGTISMIQGSSTLNIPALVMVTLVFAPMLGVSRIVLSIAAGLLIGPLVVMVLGKRGQDSSGEPEDTEPGDEDEVSRWGPVLTEAFRDWAKATVGYLVRMGPIMIVAGFASGLAIQWISEGTISTYLGNNVQGVLIAATFGILINVPLLFEIPLVALLLLMGMGTAPAATLLFAAAAGGPVTFWGLAKIMPRRAIVTFAAATWTVGLVGGLVVMGLGAIGGTEASGGLADSLTKSITTPLHTADVDDVVNSVGKAETPSRVLSDIPASFYESAGAHQGNSLVLMVTPAATHMSEPGEIRVFQGFENNRANTVEGIIFVELVMPDGSVIPTKEVYGEHFSIDPLGRDGGFVTFDIGALTDGTGEMALRFRCEEEGVEIARKTYAFTVGEQSPPLFTDITAQAGALLRHVPNPEDEELTFGNGVAFEDYDKDGFLDIYVTNQIGGNALFHSNRDGTFTDRAAEAGVDLPAALSNGVAFADYDNDGYRDLYVLNFGPNMLFQNTGDGTFTDVTAIAGVGHPGRGMSAAWGDYDLDGHLDIYLTNHYSQLKTDASHIRTGGDPKSDPLARDVLYHNNGDGTFEDVTRLLGMDGMKTATGFAASFVDYDYDGDSDIYLVNDIFIGLAYEGNVLWRNDGPDGDGGWTFTEVTDASGADAALSGMGLAVGDYDNDGFEDLFMSNIRRPFLYHNNGDGTFEDVTDRAGVGHSNIDNGNAVSWGVAFIDYDNDGWLDAYLNTGNLRDLGDSAESDPLLQPNVLFRNNRDGTFTDVSGLSGADSPDRARVLAYGDYDNDGYLDLYVGNYGSPTALYRNEGRGNNWLAITTEGTVSNRDGIGAKVRVTANGITQLREVRSGAGYGSGSEIGAYFGLERSAQADVVEITWPSGLVQTLYNVPANQKLHVIEVDATASLRGSANDYGQACIACP